jgi:hypothetical protein
VYTLSAAALTLQFSQRLGNQLGALMDKPIDLKLTITNIEDDASGIQQSARDLAASLNQQDHIDATLPTSSPAPGHKGDPITIGAILLHLLSNAGVISALIGVLKAYFDRKPKIQIELRRPDGKSLHLQAKDLSEGETRKLTAALEDFTRV